MYLPANPLPSFDDTVTLVVGLEPEKKFNVIAGILASSSTFMRTALKKEWKDGRVRKIHLPQEDPETIRRYLHFIYRGEIPSKVDGVATRQDVPFKGEYRLLADLYVLGETLQDVRFKNAILDAMMVRARFQGQSEEGKQVAFYPPNNAINTIYRGTTSYSPARRMMVDFHVQRGKKEWLDTDQICPEFVLDLAKALQERPEKLEWDTMLPMKYHETENPTE